ncbi:hypothetical protein SAMN05428969_0839 [Devosia sp. YR412]|nr:hypothetical protein SAMN05428969_0839 [Devosia sp. YR412]
MTDLIFWLWGPGVLLVVVLFAMYINRSDKRHPGE